MVSSSTMSDDSKHEAVMAAIDSLKGATELGFSQVHSRLDRVEARLTSVEGEVRGMRQWRDLVDARLDRLQARA